MNLNITPQSQILEELTEIDSFLNITASEQIEEIVLRGNDLVVYISRTGKLLADAKYWLNQSKKNEVLEIITETTKETKATAKAVNALVDSVCRKDQYLVDWCERCNRSATHQLDWCRTLISKAKEEMRLSGMYVHNKQ